MGSVVSRFLILTAEALVFLGVTGGPPPAAEPAPAAPSLPGPRVLATLPGSPRAISHDRRWVAVVEGNDVAIIRIADGKTAVRLTGHASTISGVDFSADGRRVATCSHDDTVRLWDIATGKELGRRAVASADFEAVAFSPLGSLLAALNDDKQLWICPADGGSPQKSPTNTSSHQRQVAFSSDGKSLASVGGGALILWDTAATRQRETVKTGETGVTFGPQESLLATYGGGNVIRLRNPTDGAVVRELQGHSHAVEYLAFAPNGKYLASTAAEERDALVWKTATGEVVLRLPHRQKVAWVSFSADGRQLLTFGEQLHVWELSALEDPAKLAVLAAYCDGEKDHYARFIRMSLAREIGPTVPYRGPKAGRVITTVVRRMGTTLEATDLQLGGNSIKGSISVKTDQGALNIEARKIQSLKVVRRQEKNADVTFHFLDGKTQDATMPTGAGTVRGESALGSFTDDLAEIDSLSFDVQDLGEKAGDESSSSTPHARAEVVDSQGGRLVASGIKTASYSGNDQLPVFLDGMALKVHFRRLREIQTLAAPRGGVIVKLTLLNGPDLFGFISTGDMSAITGTLAYGSFTLNLQEVKTIRFHD